MCFKVAVFIVNSLAVVALNYVIDSLISPVYCEVKSLSFFFFHLKVEQRIDLLLLTMFSRSVRMRVEVDREREASSGC